MKRFHIQFIIKSQYTLQKWFCGVALQWLRGQINYFPKDDFLLFQRTSPKSIIDTRRIPITTFNFKDIITFFIKGSTKMTFFAIFKIILISHIYIHDKGCSNLLSQGFIFIHVLRKGHRSTQTRNTSLYIVTYNISFKKHQIYLQVILHTYIKSSIYIITSFI